MTGGEADRRFRYTTSTGVLRTSGATSCDNPPCELISLVCRFLPFDNEGIEGSSDTSDSLANDAYFIYHTDRDRLGTDLIVLATVVAQPNYGEAVILREIIINP